MFKKIKKWLFGEKYPTYTISIDGEELGTTTGPVTVSKEGEYFDVRNDQSCTSQARVTKLQPIPSGMDNLIVGTYNIAVNGYDIGSTTGNCDIEFVPEDFENKKHVRISTLLQELDEEHMKLLGFEPDDLGHMSYEPKEIELDSLIVCGPGPGCGVRYAHLGNPKIVPVKTTYTLTTDSATNMRIVFQGDSLIFKDSQECMDHLATRERSGESYV